MYHDKDKNRALMNNKYSLFQARSFKETIRIPRETEIVAFNLKLERSQKSNCRLRDEPVGAHAQKKSRKIRAVGYLTGVRSLKRFAAPVYCF